MVQQLSCCLQCWRSIWNQVWVLAAALSIQLTNIPGKRAEVLEPYCPCGRPGWSTKRSASPGSDPVTEAIWERSSRQKISLSPPYLPLSETLPLRWINLFKKRGRGNYKAEFQGGTLPGWRNNTEKGHGHMKLHYWCCSSCSDSDFGNAFYYAL